MVEDNDDIVQLILIDIIDAGWFIFINEKKEWDSFIENQEFFHEMNVIAHEWSELKCRGWN